jgi:hypothetical protein
VAIVVKSLGGALTDVDAADAIDATHSWRADLAAYPDVLLVAVYDDTACEAHRFEGYASLIETRTRERIDELIAAGASSPFTVSFETISSRHLSVFDAGRLAPIDFDYVTYGGSESDGPSGIEPMEENL